MRDETRLLASNRAHTRQGWQPHHRDLGGAPCYASESEYRRCVCVWAYISVAAAAAVLQTSSHLELPPHLDVLLALGDPHHGGEDEHQRGSKHGAPEAHHEPEVREQHADGGEEGEEQGGSDLALGLGRVLRRCLVTGNGQGAGPRACR